MGNLKFKLKQLSERHNRRKLKHLRGRHDQLDHAWNRGTGGGTVSGDDYQAAIKIVDQQLADGEINQETADRTRAVLRKKANVTYDAITRASLGMARIPRRRRAATQISNIRQGLFSDDRVFDGFPQPQPLNLNLTPITTVPVTSAPVSPVSVNNNILAPFTNNLQLNIPGRIVNPYAALAAIHDATYDTQAADYARFKPQRPRATRTLARLPFIRRQIVEAQDSAQADKDSAETASQIVKSMSFRRAGSIGFLTGEINQLIKQYDTLANGMFANSNFIKNQLASLQQRITEKKAELYAEQGALAAETRANFKADTPSVIATPVMTDLNSLQQSQVRSALDKISMMMDASQLRTSHGGPFKFEVKGERLGPNGPLALHRANIVRDSLTNEIDWTQSGSEIIINLDATDQATIESSVVHEFGHVLQTQAANDFINDHADYIANRLAGEPLRFADDGTAFYEDLFTRTYSGAIGNNNSLRPLTGMPYEAVSQIARANGMGTAFPMEALSTGLEQYIMDPHGMMINDPDLFMHINALLTGKSAKLRTAQRIADDAAAAAGITPPAPGPVLPGTGPALPGATSLKHPAFNGSTNANGISYTKADLSHPFTDPMIDITDASGTVVGQRRAVPYIDEVDPASLHTDLSNDPRLINRLGNLQRAVDKEYAAAMKSTGEQRAMHMVRAAQISATIFQTYPDIRALENALAFASDMEVSNLPVGHPLETIVNDINNYGSFWLHPFSFPGGKITADAIPAEIEPYGVPGFNLTDQFDIYESVPFISIPSWSGVQLYRDQDTINQRPFISDAEISATPLASTPPTTPATTPLTPGMIAPPVTPGTPVTPATTPLTPGMITPPPSPPISPATMPLTPDMITPPPSPPTTPKTTPLSVINATEMIDRYVGDAQATEFLISPQFYPTGFGKNVGQYETMKYRRNAGEREVSVRGRRKAPYIDEVSLDALPDSLQNDPVTVAKLSVLQRRYDAAIANAWAFARGSGDPSWRLEAARIAAEMFNLYPDARVLADAQKIMPKANDFNVSDTESRELAKTVADYVNYWSSPTRYIPPAPDFGGYIKPASRVELPMPESIKKFGIPGQNLSPRVQIYDHLTKNPDTQFKYGQGLPAGSTSVLKDMADGRILPQTDSFVQDSEYDTTDVTKALPVQAAARSSGNAAKAIPDVSDSVKNILATRPPVVMPATPATTPATTPLTDTEATTTPKKPRKPKPANADEKILPDEPPGTDEEMLSEGELLQGTTFSDKTPGVAGKEAIAYAPNPKNIFRVRHRIVDLGDIKASNLLSGSVNPEYDPALQPRDRERDASRAQTNDIAKDLRPAILIRDGQQTATGSPIINADGMVLSGNGRVMALQMIQDDSLYPGRADAYREEVLKRAESLGIDPSQIAGMKFPVVVRELAEDVDSASFARDANAPSSARMSPIEEARIDARTVTPELIALIDPGDGDNINEALQSPSGKAFTRAFLGLLPANERSAYLTKGGYLNANGLIRAKAAVFAATFNSAVGDELTTALLDGTGDMKSIETGLAGALPALAKIAAEARRGNINPDMDPTNDLATAIVALGRILNMPALSGFPRKSKVSAWLNQGDFTIPEGTEKLTPAARTILEHIDTIANSPRKLRQFFNDLAQNIMAQKEGTGQESLFGDLGIAPMDLNDVVKATIATQEPSSAPSKPAPAKPAPATPAPATPAPATPVTTGNPPAQTASTSSAVFDELGSRTRAFTNTTKNVTVRDPSKQPVPSLISPVVIDTGNITPKTGVYDNTDVVETDVQSGDTSPTVKNNRPYWTSRTNFAMPDGILLDAAEDPTYFPFAFMPDVQTMFRTGRGSTYAINGNGQSIRNRSGKNHVSKTTGLEPIASEIYFYHPKDDNKIAGFRQAMSNLRSEKIPHEINVFSDDTGALSIGLVILEDQYLDDGTLLREKGSIAFAVPISRTPAVGLSPFDIFRKNDGTIEDSHLGNEITEIVQSPDTPLYDFPGMPVPAPTRSRTTTPPPASNRAIPIPTDPLANTNRILTDSSSPDANTPQSVVVGNNGKEYPDSELFQISQKFIKSGGYGQENFVDFDKLIAEAGTANDAEYVKDARDQFLKMAKKIEQLEEGGFDGRPITTASAIKNIETYSELIQGVLDVLDDQLSPEMKAIICRNAADVIEKYGKTYNVEWSAEKKENKKKTTRNFTLDENLKMATSVEARSWKKSAFDYARMAESSESTETTPSTESSEIVNTTPDTAVSPTENVTSPSIATPTNEVLNTSTDNPPTPVGQRSPLQSIIPNPQASVENFSDAAKQEINDLTQQLVSSQTKAQNIRLLDRLEVIYSQRLYDNVTPAEKYAIYNDLLQIADAMPNAVADSNMPETVKRRMLVRINKHRREYLNTLNNLMQQSRFI